MMGDGEGKEELLLGEINDADAAPPRALSRRLLGRDVEGAPRAYMRTPLYARSGGGGIFFRWLCLEVTVL